MLGGGSDEECLGERLVRGLACLWPLAKPARGIVPSNVQCTFLFTIAYADFCFAFDTLSCISSFTI